jgi:hypothetical protein
MKAIAILIAVGACGGSSPQPVQPAPPLVRTPAAPSCLAVSDRMTILRSSQEPEPEKAELRDFAILVKERCAIDQWSDEARDCYGTAETGAVAEGCAKTLTPDQNLTIMRMIEARRAAEAAGHDAVLQKYQEITDQACQCRAGDTACAQKVSDDLTKWAQAQPAKTTTQPDPRLEEVVKRLTECITNAMMPAPAPAAPAKSGTKKKPVDK